MPESCHDKSHDTVTDGLTLSYPRTYKELAPLIQSSPSAKQHFYLKNSPQSLPKQSLERQKEPTCLKHQGCDKCHGGKQSDLMNKSLSF